MVCLFFFLRSTSWLKTVLKDQHQYLLRQKLLSHGAESSPKYYSLCISNCRLSTINTSVLISFLGTFSQIQFRQGFPAMFEGSKQIWKFSQKKLLTFDHLWCPHWDRLQQLLLHQSPTPLDFSSYQSANFVKKISSSENSLYQFIV